MQPRSQAAFTLIELSLVLVIIGLIVGGVLAGQALIANSAINAQITQIQKYNTAVNTFRDKYGMLPGDMNAPTASQFGFQSRSGAAAYGDGNGILECNGGAVKGNAQCQETLLFWVDLSTALLIDGKFNDSSAEINCECNTMGFATPAALYNSYWPQAKLGSGNYVNVYSGGIRTGGYGVGTDGINYFGLSTAPTANFGHGSIATNPPVTVAQAYAIDTKIDDGKPLVGRVQAFYNNNGYLDYPVGQNPDTATSCYNNSTNNYSVTMNSGLLNCGVLFKFQ